MTPSRPLSPQIAERPGTLRFSTPARLAVVAVLAMAAIVLGSVLLPRYDGAPPTSDGSATGSATAAPTTQSLEPSPTLTPSLTTAPTPLPTPAPPAVWTALTWSEPVTPSFVVDLNDLLPWGDGYVAAGSVPVGAGLSQAAFLTSPDGLDWTLTYQIDPVGERYPQHLVAYGDSLFAFSPRARDDVEIIVPSRSYSGPLMWTSTDGTEWTLVDSPSWEEGWRGARQHVGALPPGWDPTQYPIVTGLVDVASGPDGMVAIGNSFTNGGLSPILLHSVDGETWSKVSLPASVSPLLNEVVRYDGVFVLVGATDIGADPSTATPAAWFSRDGTSWIRATVNVDETLFADGSEGIGYEMGAVATGADGLVGWWGPRRMVMGVPRFLGEWTSADGQTLQPRDVNTYPPYYSGHVSGDGVRMVALPDTYHRDTGQWSPIDRAWISTDGAIWQPLTLSADMPDRHEAFWVVPDGVIYAGVRSFWFGVAQVAE
jgi:hypothetical protein